MKENSPTLINSIPRNKIIKVILAIFICCSSYFISTYYYQVMLIQGESMSPTYHNMSMVLLNKFSENYSYGDVIAFQSTKLASVLVKRVVACPGDTIYIKQGILYVNYNQSEVFPEDYVFDYEGILSEPIYLLPGQYAVIGDNIAKSKDSRNKDVGIIDKEDIIGIVIDNW